MVSLGFSGFLPKTNGFLNLIPKHTPMGSGRFSDLNGSGRPYGFLGAPILFPFSFLFDGFFEFFFLSLILDQTRPSGKLR